MNILQLMLHFGIIVLHWTLITDHPFFQEVICTTVRVAVILNNPTRVKQMKSSRNPEHVEHCKNTIWYDWKNNKCSNFSYHFCSNLWTSPNLFLWYFASQILYTLVLSPRFLNDIHILEKVKSVLNLAYLEAIHVEFLNFTVFLLPFLTSNNLVFKEAPKLLVTIHYHSTTFSYLLELSLYFRESKYNDYWIKDFLFLFFSFSS